MVAGTRDRNRIEHMVPAERLLRSTLLAVDGLGEDPGLDEARQHLVLAQSLIGTYVDEHPTTQAPTGTVEGQANASNDQPTQQEADPEFMRKRRMGLK